MTTRKASSAQAELGKVIGEKLVLIDGHALAYRAYFALPAELRNAKGETTNAVLGFTQMLLDTLKSQAPQYVVVTFDKGRTFRHEEYAEYKAKRASMPDDLRPQFARIREIISALGIPVLELAGYEADDLIGTLSRQAEEIGLETVILTADNDQHQLVTEHVHVLAPGGYYQRFSEARLYDVQAVQDRYGFGPELVPDYKALVGDKSDNIPNVPGIGEKTATALLVQYGSLEGVLDHLNELKPKQQEMLRVHAEQARRSKQLTTIVCDVPITLDVDASRMNGFDKEGLLRIFQELEFRSLVGKVNQVEAVLAAAVGNPMTATQPEQIVSDEKRVEPELDDGKARQLDMFAEKQPSGEARSESQDRPPPSSANLSNRSSLSALEVSEDRILAGVPATVHVILDEEALAVLEARLRGDGRFTVDVEATSQDDMDAALVGIAIAPTSSNDQVDEAFYIPVGHGTIKGDGQLFERDAKQMEIEVVRARLGPILADPSVIKDGHNIKYDVKVLARAGMPVSGLGFDTMIAAYLLGEKGISLKDLAFTKLGVQMVPITELIGKGRTQITMDKVSIETSAGYASADVAVTERLRHLFGPQLESVGMRGLLEEIEMPLVGVLAEMELTGVAIDVPALQTISTSIHTKLIELETLIYEEAKHPFNINSPSQLGKVLFEELQLPGRKRTQTGYSTDREVLDTLRGLHPIVDMTLEYRQLIKLKNTYIDALPLLVRADTGRVHTNFNQTVAATGRLSSSQPNLQNIPIRTEIGRDVRKAFVADNSSRHSLFDGEESVLLAADYSQIELRLLAHMAQDERLIAAFEAGLDIHAATAAEVMGVPLEKVDPDSRRLAKTINFGVLYGMGSYGLARDSNLTQAEAAKFIELYWSRYPAVRNFMEQTLRLGRELGYVSTLLGRRRYMPELNSPRGDIRAQGERMAINAPVQGTAADIIKIAMNRLQAELAARKLKSRMLLQVHDELLFEVPRSELAAMSELVCSVMEGSAELSVPLKVDIRAGQNWGDMTPVAANG
ncbi:MAG: DNA polymerase I [Chloroflexia bacterium]